MLDAAAAPQRLEIDLQRHRPRPTARAWRCCSTGSPRPSCRPLAALLALPQGVAALARISDVEELLGARRLDAGRASVAAGAVARRRGGGAEPCGLAAGAGVSVSCAASSNSFCSCSSCSWVRLSAAHLEVAVLQVGVAHEARTGRRRCLHDRCRRRAARRACRRRRSAHSRQCHVAVAARSGAGWRSHPAPGRRRHARRRARSSGSTRYGPALDAPLAERLAEVAVVACRGPARVAGSNRPPMPTVVLSTRRPGVVDEGLELPLQQVVHHRDRGTSRLSKKLVTPVLHELRRDLRVALGDGPERPPGRARR